MSNWTETNISAERVTSHPSAQLRVVIQPPSLELIAHPAGRGQSWSKDPGVTPMTVLLPSGDGWWSNLISSYIRLLSCAVLSHSVVSASLRLICYFLCPLHWADAEVFTKKTQQSWKWARSTAHPVRVHKQSLVLDLGDNKAQSGWLCFSPFNHTFWYNRVKPANRGFPGGSMVKHWLAM